MAQRVGNINSGEKSVFWYVDANKLAVMSLVTFRLYEIFWLYKNWTYIKTARNGKMQPFWRAWFSPIWIYPLLKEVAEEGKQRNSADELPAGQLAIAYVVLFLCGRFLQGQLQVIGWFSFIPLLSVQEYINSINKEQSTTPINSRFTAVNWIAILVGGSLSIITAMNLFCPSLLKGTPFLDFVIFR